MSKLHILKTPPKPVKKRANRTYQNGNKLVCRLRTLKNDIKPDPILKGCIDRYGEIATVFLDYFTTGKALKPNAKPPFSLGKEFYKRKICPKDKFTSTCLKALTDGGFLVMNLVKVSDAKSYRDYQPGIKLADIIFDELCYMRTGTTKKEFEQLKNAVIDNDRKMSDMTGQMSTMQDKMTDVTGQMSTMQASIDLLINTLNPTVDNEKRKLFLVDPLKAVTPA